MKKPVTVFLLSIASPVLFLFAAYAGCGLFLDFYIVSGAKRLVKLERQGRLSREYGYVWQEINANQEMNRAAGSITGNGAVGSDSRVSASGKTHDFPSLAAVALLNGFKNLNRTIRINDRSGILLAELRTTHTSVKLSDLNEILLESLVTTEDKRFYTRKRACDYNALLRSAVHAALLSLRTMKVQYPRGSSTIHMQVARFLLMRYDRRGYAYAEKSVSRKLKELKLAQALKMVYANDEILTLYINHCVSAGRGMLGYHDISMGLFGVTPDKLSVPRSLYLARLVKWNRQVPGKIICQIKASLPALAKKFRWNTNGRKTILQSLDTLTFKQPVPLVPRNGYLLDLANEYWRTICRRNGLSDRDLADMDIADPESMIRRYGNLTITLTIDYRLQKLLEEAVGARGFGPDTTIRTDVSIGGYGSNLNGTTVPPDTVRKLLIAARDTLFTGSFSAAPMPLKTGDTVVCNIRYKKTGSATVRRSCHYYKRDTLRVPGQYYAYALMDSRTHRLLAYCSRDRLGSRLRSLLVNTNPNGSSVAKPLIYALAYDLGIYKPSGMASDDREVPDTCEWARTYLYREKNPVGMVYAHVPEKGGYRVQNHDQTFGGYDFLYNHLSYSNNIMAVETMYRLTTDLAVDNDRSRNVKKLLERLGRKDLAKLPAITGPQLYRALVSVVRDTGMEHDGYARHYSVVLGTLELTLYEQMHLFNALYDNTLVLAPDGHPSLFVKKIQLAGSDVPFADAIETRALFMDRSAIEPVRLALHKRLVSNPADRLGHYDIRGEDDGFPSNFAKSGTTDDIIRPFNADITDTARANYGLWNAVLRVRLTRDDLRKAIAADTLLKNPKSAPDSYDSVPAEEFLDVTLACIGECNKHYTEERDGKTLHGYVSRVLLHEFGIPCTTGMYADYEDELVRETSEGIKYANRDESDLSFLSRALIKLRTGLGTKASVDEIRFEWSRHDSSICLKGNSYRRMLKFAPYMGDKSRYYCDLLDKLKTPGDIKGAKEIIAQISAIPTSNQVLKRDVGRACSSLQHSLDELENLGKER